MPTFKVAIGPDQNVYVLDSNSNQVIKFASWDSNAWVGEISRWSFDGTFTPRDLVIDNQGNIYILDEANYQIHIFDLEGNYLYDFDVEAYPIDLTIDDSGNIVALSQGTM